MRCIFVNVTRLLVCLLVAWFIVLIVISWPFAAENDSSQSILKNLNIALKELEIMKRQNLRLWKSLAEFEKLKSADGAAIKNIPDFSLLDVENHLPGLGADYLMEIDVLTRTIQNNALESWYYTRSQIMKLKDHLRESNPDLGTDLDRILNNTAHHHWVSMYDINQLRNVNTIRDWRIQESNKLGDLIQRRLEYLQNPEDCSKAKKLICNLNKGCGYGCQIHHVVYCLIVAYGTQRTLILKSKGWRYNSNGWEAVFKPVSDTCNSPDGESRSGWPGSDRIQVIELPIIDSISPRPDFLPLAVPEDIASSLAQFHGNPIVWWIGQLIKYLLRPQPHTEKLLRELGVKHGFKKPIVGIHVRRTDKVGTEAQYHNIHEYMQHVEEYFNMIEIKEKVDARRVYVASDDPSVIEEARKLYPKYKFIGDPEVAKLAALTTRYGDASLKGIIMDVHFLSLCDYIVCTFSSQVCRIAYEIMQTQSPDASLQFKSLDDIYYYGGQNGHNQVARWSHEPQGREEILLRAGDEIAVAGNHWNGYSKGLNLRSGATGLYPSYKVKEKLTIAKFPTYPEVSLIIR